MCKHAVVEQVQLSVTALGWTFLLDLKELACMIHCFTLESKTFPFYFLWFALSEALELLVEIALTSDLKI